MFLSASFGGYFLGVGWLVGYFCQKCFLSSRHLPQNISTINLLRNLDSRLLINMLPSTSLNISCQSFSV